MYSNRFRGYRSACTWNESWHLSMVVAKFINQAPYKTADKKNICKIFKIHLELDPRYK